MELAGLRVLITGASRGIGAAIAERAAAGGAGVVLVARDAQRLGEVAKRTGGSVIVADLCDPAQVVGLVDRVEAAHGVVDVIVNNAGIDVSKPLWEHAPDEVERIVRLNLLVPIELSRQAVVVMRPRRSGRVVNVSSLSGVVAVPGFASYGATKAGLTHFTACLRADLQGSGVGTTVVEVGPVRTDFLVSVEGCETVRRSYARLRRMGLLPTIDASVVADGVIRAIRHDHEHVRLPTRTAAASLVAGVPRMVVGVLTTGIRHRTD
jgi:uncharacterized protein